MSLRIASARFRPLLVPTLSRSFGAGFPMNPYLDRGIVTENVLEMMKSFEKVDPAKVTETAHFEKDLGLDSLDTVEVVMGLEEEFMLTMSDEQADKISSVKDAIDYVCQHPNAKACRPLGF